MALSLRRTSHEPRLEMMPLLDVIFLLLTFFIFSQVMMIRANVMPWNLLPVASGQTAAESRVLGITVDRTGGIYLNREAVAMADLPKRFAEVGKLADPPQVFLAMEADSAGVDRGPLLVKLVEMLQAAGIEQFSIVGRPNHDDSP